MFIELGRHAARIINNDANNTNYASKNNNKNYKSTHQKYDTNKSTQLAEYFCSFMKI